MSKDQMDGLRSEYMVATKDLILAAVTRNEIMGVDLCPRSMQSTEETAEALKKVAKLNLTIADLCNKQRAVEQRANGKLGIPAVFGADLPNVLRVAVAVLATACLAGGVLEQDVRYLSRLTTLSATTASPDDLLAVREAFSSTGVLRPHVHCEPGRTIHEMANLSLTENDFRTFLALAPDSECQDLLDAKALVGVTGRRG